MPTDISYQLPSGTEPGTNAERGINATSLIIALLALLAAVLATCALNAELNAAVLWPETWLVGP